MRQQTIIFFISLFVIGCNSTKHHKLALRHCVEEKANKYLQDVSDESSYYNMLQNFEELMVTSGVLENRNQTSYLNLVKKVLNGDKEISKLYLEHAETINTYSGVASLTMMRILFTCPDELIKPGIANEEAVNEWTNRIQIADQLSASGYKNFDKFKAYIHSYSIKQFKDIEYRGSTINIIIFLIEGNYNPKIDYKDNVKIYTK